MLTKSNRTLLWGFQQIRGFLARHVYEPRLIVRVPEGADKKPLDVDHRKPAVLLIGWAGAEHEHLAKYSSIYTEQGYRTIAFIAPCYHYTIPNARNGFYLSPVLRGIDAKPGNFESFRHCPLVCHIFSMNGVRSLISLWKWTEAEQVTYLRKRIKGVIFDSAPARTSSGPDSHAVVNSTPPIEGLHWVDKETRRKFIRVAFNLRKGMAHSISALYPPLRSQLSMYYYLLECMDLPIPQLYFYSHEDTFVKHKYVKRFLEQQRERGKDVEEIVFEGSEHVQHFRKYPEQYRSACVKFLQKVDSMSS
ncbi:hypothetical protein Y032_0008g310 [Ancylostoma ceylanicum]|uniref:AB hydrolase-1 domain-containing protein n=2 Tax=Ancylostoma ceylanicum TaxID=53326 RepID=A0A016VM41_9BILA|nr:hypothetical protein Y032_0008g310 [Ancylostoma ceylanicum]